MRNKIQHLICIGIIICSVSSCVFAGKDILYGQPKGFVNDYSEKLNNIDQMIKVDGYYQSDRLSHNDLLSIIVDKQNSHFDSRGHCNALIESENNTLLAFKCLYKEF